MRHLHYIGAEREKGPGAQQKGRVTSTRPLTAFGMQSAGIGRARFRIDRFADEAPQKLGHAHSLGRRAAFERIELAARHHQRQFHDAVVSRRGATHFRSSRRQHEILRAFGPAIQIDLLSKQDASPSTSCLIRSSDWNINTYTGSLAKCPTLSRLRAQRTGSGRSAIWHIPMSRLGLTRPEPAAMVPARINDTKGLARFRSRSGKTEAGNHSWN